MKLAQILCISWDFDCKVLIIEGNALKKKAGRRADFRKWKSISDLIFPLNICFFPSWNWEGQKNRLKPTGGYALIFEAQGWWNIAEIQIAVVLTFPSNITQQWQIVRLMSNRTCIFCIVIRCGPSDQNELYHTSAW